MPADSSDPRVDSGGSWYSYAVLRVVPRVERAEFINVGVILFARTLGFLDARIEMDEMRLQALHNETAFADLQAHLETFRAICAGDSRGGPIAALSQSERFHWLTAPRSTVLQTSPVHVGCCRDGAVELEALMERLVR